MVGCVRHLKHKIVYALEGPSLVTFE